MSATSPATLLRVAGGVCLLVALAVMMIWFIGGASMVTQYQVMQTEVVEDEFGDEVEREALVDQFQFGLLPDKGYDGAAPLAGFFAVLGGGLLFAARRKKASSGEQTSDTPSADGDPNP